MELRSPLRGMTTATKRLNPVLNDLPVMKPLRRHPTSKIDNPIVHQATKADRGSFLSPREGMLMRSQPVDFIFRDHACGQAFEEKFAKRHRKFVTKSLHHDAGVRPPRAQPQISLKVDPRGDMTNL